MNDKKAALIILAATAAIVAAMLPLREQGFTDDFAYAQSVRQFLATGELKVTDFSMVTLVFPILWGSLFAKIFGFSFVSLQLSTIAFLPILGIGIYLMLRQFGSPAKKSLLMTIFFLSVPWIFQFTFTFMNDIPFLGLLVWGIYFYARGIKEKGAFFLIIGSLTSSLAFLTRQIGIVTAIAAALSLAAGGAKNRSKFIKLLVAGLLIPAAAAGWYAWWLSIPDNITMSQIAYHPVITKHISSLLPGTAMQFSQRIEIWKMLFHRLMEYLSQAMGLTAPLVLTVAAINIKGIWEFIHRRRVPVALSLFFLGGLYALDVAINRNGYMAGFPLMIYQYEAWLPAAWEKYWKYLVGVSIPIWVIFLLMTAVKIKSSLTGERIFLLLSFIGLIGSIVLSHYSWEEYLIPLLPFVFLWLGSIFSQFNILKWQVAAVAAVLFLDSLQMAKLRYDEEGIAWNKAMEMVNDGVFYRDISPNRNLAWEGWFYYEKYVEYVMMQARGDKRIAAILPSWEINKSPLYFISPEREVRRLRLNLNGEVVETIKGKSMLVDTKVLVYKLNGENDIYNIAK